MRSELVQAVLLGVFIITATSAYADAGAACQQKKAEAAGKKAADLLKAFGKDEKKPNGTKLAKRISRAESKFTEAFVKAEAKGGCPTSDDASAIEVLVDAFVDDLALNTQEAADWPNFGGGLHNSHRGHAPGLGPEAVSGLTVKWVYETTPPEAPVGDVSVPPAVVDGALYFPDWAGSLHAVDAETGNPLWKKSFKADYSSTGKFFLMSRNTPAVEGDVLYVGSQVNLLLSEEVAPRDGAIVAAINRHDGTLIWSTKVDEHPGAIITQSPVVYEERVYVGVSSMEEFLSAVVPGYPCCTFRGSVVSLNTRNGAVIWKTYMTPGEDDLSERDPNGYSGNAVWGGMPALDLRNQAVLVATGNNYEVPEEVATCEAERLEAPNPEDLPRCDADDNFVNTIVSLDMKTGAVNWAARLGGFDAWNAACGDIPFIPNFNPENCPDPTGPDFDFGEAPMLLDVRIDGQLRRLAVAGQKSGTVWAVDAATGEMVWSRVVGPGGFLGGMLWSSATDGRRIYALNANSANIEWELVNPSGPETSTTGGFLTSLDAVTGEIVWQTPDPAASRTMGSISVASGVVYAGSFDAAGTMRAFDASSGEELWSFASGGFVNTGPAIVRDVVYWGSGYTRTNPSGANNKLHAFEVP